MTKAVFKKRKTDSIICFICGLVICALFVFVKMEGNILWGIAIGIVICIYSIISYLFNFKAYLYIKDCHIKGKYHWFAKIDCHVSDVDFAWSGINTLTVQLKSGKCYTIMGVENSRVLCAAIRHDMSFDITEQPESLKEKLDEMKSEKKKGLLYVCIGIALMFANIFATVFLTGEREMQDFSKTDWIIFSIMCAVELATVIYLFYFARLTGKYNIPIEKLKYAIRRTVIETEPLYYDYVIQVLTDTDCSYRVIIEKNTTANTFSYTLQEINEDYILIKTYSSDSFDSIDELPEEFEFLTDITDKVLR